MRICQDYSIDVTTVCYVSCMLLPFICSWYEPFITLHLISPCINYYRILNFDLQYKHMGVHG